MSISPITKDQATKILKAFFYVAASFVLASIPVWLAKNAVYIALAVPINVLLVTLKQLITKEEEQVPEPIMHGVTELTSEITDTAGNPVVDPNAPR